MVANLDEVLAFKHRLKTIPVLRLLKISFIRGLLLLTNIVDIKAKLNRKISFKILEILKNS